jgi:ABC-2 type transport system permease protein
MKRTLVVARREYLERIRAKSFWIGTLLGPALIFGITVGPAYLMKSQKGKNVRLAVLDASGDLREAVESVLMQPRNDDTRPHYLLQSAGEGDLETRRGRLRAAILAGTLDGYLYLAPNALETSTAEYFAKNVSDITLVSHLQSAVHEALIAVRFAKDGFDPGRAKSLTRKLDLKPIRVSATGEREDRAVGLLFSSLLLVMLYTTVLMWGQVVMSGVIEEKTNRVVEVMASTIPATTLFLGKLAGVGAAGLTQFLVWVLSMAVVGAWSGAASMTGGTPLPEITPLLLGSFVLFFLLGYFLYASLYAAVGAAVNTIQEAQNLLFPLIMPLIGALVCFPIVLRNPEGTLAVVLSLIPIFTPLIMFLRISVLTPPLWQIALSVVLTGATIGAVVWLSARIYRVGILMYGKRPTFPEIVRWVRHS